MVPLSESWTIVVLARGSALGWLQGAGSCGQRGLSQCGVSNPRCSALLTVPEPFFGFWFLVFLAWFLSIVCVLVFLALRTRVFA